MMTQIVNNLLTLEEIRQQLDVAIDQLRGITDRQEVRDYCGAVPNPRTRGVAWPHTAVPILTKLLAMRQTGKLEPKNIKSILADLEMSVIGQSGLSPDGALVTQNVPSEVQIGQSGRPTDGALVRQIGQSDLSPDPLEVAAANGHAQGLAVNDCVFDALGAAEYLCCSVRMLRRNVPASFRLGKSAEGDRWYRRDLLSLKGGAR
jgi:hypothetical protein